MKNWNTEQLQAELDRGSKIFLKLSRNGCPPCKASHPTCERLEAEFQEVVFGELNIEENPEVLESLGIRGVPAFFVFESKEIKGQLLGWKGPEELKKLVMDAFPNE